MKDLIKRISKYKLEEICIIFDFDDTLTKGIIDGKRRGSNSFSVFVNNTYLLGKDYSNATNLLFKHYYNLEQDPNLNETIKTKAIQEWWLKEFELYIKYNLTTNILDEIIKNKFIELRGGVYDFF